ncbi:hypothetical protein [Aureibacillus halotolerans]|uniref:Uncharacterized protein n=1 Tax=Aureibacillus halotolerans TaxID=1508390 RepID=A0A4R6TVU7_9BACI|nr:hypothetical protein [Aureibacillus halotolerans]TDQ36119.1 hypothetical protein EV213_12050 [Aureibacillus halotolerans]
MKGLLLTVCGVCLLVGIAQAQAFTNPPQATAPLATEGSYETVDAWLRQATPTEEDSREALQDLAFLGSEVSTGAEAMRFFSYATEAMAVVSHQETVKLEVGTVLVQANQAAQWLDHGDQLFQKRFEIAVEMAQLEK